MRLRAHRIALACTLAASLLAACAKTDDSADELAADDTTEVQDDTASSSSAPAQPAPAPSSTGLASSATLTVEDIDRWQRGMEAELKAVREAGAKVKAAKTGADTATAMFAANEMATRDAGASAAGLDPERYQFVRTAMSSAVARLSPLEMEMKVSEMPASVVDEMKKAREVAVERMRAEFPAAVIEALRSRAAALRKQEMALVGERLKAAGIGG